MKLKINGVEAYVGMKLKLRSDDELCTLMGWREPHKPNSTGRIYVRYEDETMNNEYFPGVAGKAEWVPDNWIAEYGSLLEPDGVIFVHADSRRKPIHITQLNLFGLSSDQEMNEEQTKKFCELGSTLLAWLNKNIA